MPAVEEMVSSSPERCLRITGRTDVHRAEKQRVELTPDLFGTQLLEKAGEEIAARLKVMEEEARIKTQQLQALQKKELELLRDKSALEE